LQINRIKGRGVAVIIKGLLQKTDEELAKQLEEIDHEPVA